MADQPISGFDVQEIWLSVTEAAEVLGYHRFTLQKLARENWSLPEDQRKVRVQRLPLGYILWMPDLIEYLVVKGHGPQSRRIHPNT